MPDEIDPFMAEAHMMPTPPNWFSRFLRWFGVHSKPDPAEEELFVGGKTTAPPKHNGLFVKRYPTTPNMRPTGSQHDGIDDAV